MSFVSILNFSKYLVPICLLASCSDEQSVRVTGSQNLLSLSTQLIAKIEAATNEGYTELRFPLSDELLDIPQDPNNRLTPEKIELGKLLFHDTAFSTAGMSDQAGTWSCATCHHAAAGFKAGVAQGIGEGGVSFGSDGSKRVLSGLFNGDAAEDEVTKPDIQPVASPSILNTAYQDVMLWNGQFGNAENGTVNVSITGNILMTPSTPKATNELGLSGLEVQAIAGQSVHRLDFSENSILSTNSIYASFYNSAFGASTDSVSINAGKALAAYERTVLADQAPFQQWLRGNDSAMSDSEKRGGILFFGKANCSACHQGPALSSRVGASAEDMFMAIGFNDFEPTQSEAIHGFVSPDVRNGRGGFTGAESDNLKFKIPQLYNLADANVFGHGSSFDSIRAVLEYKNQAIAQKPNTQHALDHRFVPLGLSNGELDDLEAFIRDALRDPNLMRYQPNTVPSDFCVVVDPLNIADDFICE